MCTKKKTSLAVFVQNQNNETETTKEKATKQNLFKRKEPCGRRELWPNKTNKTSLESREEHENILQERTEIFNRIKEKESNPMCVKKIIS